MAFTDSHYYTCHYLPVVARLLAIGWLVVASNVCTIQTAAPSSYHLANYDERVSSSSFGEPVFRLEPPNVVNFANSQGATILCLASGSPRPTITWYTSAASPSSLLEHGASELKQSRPVANVTNLRHITHQGAALRLLPFNESHFRQDVHSTEYRCVASNQLATIHSRSVLVQAVMSSESSNEVKVSDEFVAPNQVAVFKCRTNGAPEFIQLAEWFTSDGLRIEPAESDRAIGKAAALSNKFTAFKSGELHVNQVEMADLRRTYGCRVRNTVTGRLSSSSGLAQLIVTAIDGHANQHGSGSGAVQVIHTVSQLIGDDSIYALKQQQQQQVTVTSAKWPPKSAVNTYSEPVERRLLLPCAVKQSAPGDSQVGAHLRWLYLPPAQASGGQAVPLEQWAAQKSLGYVHYLSAAANQSGASYTSAQQQRHSATVLGQQQQSQPQPQKFSQQPASTRFVVNPTHLAIEWPSKAQSGRYICQLQVGGPSESSTADTAAAAARTLCDINVIVRRPLKLRVRNLSFRGDNAARRSRLRRAHDTSSARTWLSAAARWLRSATDEQQQQVVADQRARRHSEASGAGEEDGDEDAQEGEEDDDELQMYRRQVIGVRGAGLVAPPPIVRVGQRLKLECRGSGHPIESVKWFRNGQPINTQTSADFQLELATSNSVVDFDDDDHAAATEQVERPLSTLLVRQVQPKEVGLSVFECFAQNSLGDRARASLAVLLLDRAQVDYARSQCPLSSHVQNVSADHEQAEEFGDDDNEEEEQVSDALGAFRRHNPLQRALLLEGEPVELLCPVGRANGTHQVEWRRWTGAAHSLAGFGRAAENAHETEAQSAATLDELAAKQQQQQQQQQQMSDSVGAITRSFNQLFSGDSRFVINGSSLQIRAPAKRHDEALYACRPQGAAAGSGQQHLAYRESNENVERDEDPEAPVHQSSLAAQIQMQTQTLMQTQIHRSSCGQLMESTLFAPQHPSSHQSAATSSPPSNISHLPVSSISIRIVAKPKIDPFEFSRNLEEGMRAVVVCAVISGQSPVDITWFKDGDLLLADEQQQQLSIDQTNGFSSSLTFHRIRAAHSGLYTCVAANAFAAVNHTSHLLVNVAPYLIDPPKNTRAVLGTNVLVNCRAGGQPSPQIRWRKLVPVAGAQNNLASATAVGAAAAGSGRQLAPAGGATRLEYATTVDFLSSQSQLQHDALTSALANPRHSSEFRIVTSNSHIQVLENGSMIIKEVELSDASRYVCQAFNGISPSTSEMIELQVLSPAKFDVNYETLTVKRDSSLKFTCAPKGNQPLRLDWRKDDARLAPISSTSSSSSGSSSKYTELATYLADNSSSNQIRQQHSSLMLVPRNQQLGDAVSSPGDGGGGGGMLTSELHISYADRSDSGTFVCSASNAYGKDELIYRLLVQEAPDAPIDVQLRGGTHPNQLKLSWTSPFDGNLPLSHFLVEYRRVAVTLPAAAAADPPMQSPITSTSDWTRLVINVSGGNKLALGDSSLSSELALTSNATVSLGQQQQQQQLYSVVLRQLQARSQYQVRVVAVNAMGQSGYSQVSAAQTAEEPPTARADDLRVESVSSSALKVLWRGPQLVEEQAPIKGYYVSHRKVIAMPPIQSAPLPSIAKSELWLATATVSATANNRSDMLLSEQQQQQQQQQSLVSSMQRRQPNYELLIGELDKNSKYEVRVQPYNSMGVGPATESVGQTLKFDRPAQPSVKLMAARRQSLELKWFISDDQPLMGFSLFYKCEYDDWQEIQLGLIYHYVIENLRCGNKYQIYLSAFNQVGRSDPSDVLSVRTEGTAPIAPEKSSFLRSNITELVLDMRGWKSGGCPISSFMIQFKRMHDTNWFVLSEGQTPFTVSDKITIPDLMPATWYKLLVTALNEAGSTNAEYLFSTLTTSGEQIAPTFPIDELPDESWSQSAAGSGGKSGSSRSMLSGLSQLLFAATGGGRSGIAGNQDGGNLLLPFACIFLLLMTTVASYLYYNRAARSNSSSLSSTNSSSSSSENHRHHKSSALQQQQTGVSGGMLMGQMTLGAGGVHHHQGSGLMGCSSFANRTISRCNDEKQLIIEAPGATRQHTHMISAAEYHPSPPSSSDSNQRGQSTVFDSLLAGTSHLQSFIQPSAATLGRQAPSHSMRLLSSGNLFCGQPSGSVCPTSSSMSTHSTNCTNLDGSSVQGSSSGASSAGKAAKLQLIDESSLISGTIDESQDEHNRMHQVRYIYGQNLATSNNTNLSPMHQQLYSQSAYGDHVMLSQRDDQLGGGMNCDMYQQQQQQQQQLIEATNFANLIATQQAAGSHQLYSSSNHQRLSNSFASGAELQQRQQICSIQQAQTINEPIYQRLDNFQSQQSCFARAKSQTLRFNQAHFSLFDQDGHNNGAASDISNKFSQTLHRLNAENNQQALDSQSNQQNSLLGDNFHPSASTTLQQQVQPPASFVDFNAEIGPEAASANEPINVQHHIICNLGQGQANNELR